MDKPTEKKPNGHSLGTCSGRSRPSTTGAQQQSEASDQPASASCGYLADLLEEELGFLERVGLRRSLKLAETAPGPWFTMEGKRVLLLCSNDYLDLASHPAVKAAAREAMEAWGCGAGSARLISGTLGPHQALEERLARFLGMDSALLFGSGYMANVGAITSLAGKSDAIFSDQLNHASIIDGCRLSGARVYIYAHRDIESLEGLLRDASTFRRRLIVTEGLFGMEGDLAPLPELAGLAKRYGAILMVDDAHGIGMLGDGGRGVAEHQGLTAGPDILVGTMGKSLGSSGAFVTGSALVRDYLINRARTFLFSTAPAPAAAAAAMAALAIIEADPERRRKLLDRADYLRRNLSALGYRVLPGETAIVPVMIGEAEATSELSRRLLEEGVYAQGVRPPTVPAGACRLRCSVMATHSQQDLDVAIAAFRKVGRELGIVE